MNPSPIFDNKNYIPSNKLQGKVAIITGGDSGIGRAISILFAKEGADIAIVYLNEDEDAVFTKNYIENLGRKCIPISGDLSKETFLKEIVEIVLKEYGKIDILVNNCAVQYPQNSILDISAEQLKKHLKQTSSLTSTLQNLFYHILNLTLVL